MKFAGRIPRSRFLSFAAGVAVSYVFVHLLPELSEYQSTVMENLGDSNFRYLENHIYIIAMLGLVVFYTLERLVKTTNERKDMKKATNPESIVFWVHVGSFFIYNAIIGYLLIRKPFTDPFGLLLYFLALGVHFITNDWSMRRDHKEAYDKYGRILLSFSTLTGWTIGYFTEVNVLVLSVLQAFIAGGVILNVMKEELPENQKSSIGSFLFGIIGYTFLLLLL